MAQSILIQKHGFATDSYKVDYLKTNKRNWIVFTTIVVLLIILWLLGFLTSYTMGGIIHILLVIAVIMVLVRIIKGKRVL